MSNPPRWDLANAGAVPGTGKRSWGMPWRRPRHIGYRRALVALYGDLRGHTAPPTDYDDIFPVSDRIRNWKRHRRTQWK